LQFIKDPLYHRESIESIDKQIRKIGMFEQIMIEHIIRNQTCAACADRCQRPLIAFSGLVSNLRMMVPFYL